MASGEGIEFEGTIVALYDSASVPANSSPTTVRVNMVLNFRKSRTYGAVVGVHLFIFNVGDRVQVDDQVGEAKRSKFKCGNTSGLIVGGLVKDFHSAGKDKVATYGGCSIAAFAFK